MSFKYVIQFRANKCTVNTGHSNILTLRISEGNLHRRDRNGHSTVTRDPVVSERGGHTGFKQPISHVFGWLLVVVMRLALIRYETPD